MIYLLKDCIIYLSISQQDESFAYESNGYSFYFFFKRNIQF